VACESPVRECLAWHVTPHVSNPRPNEQGTSVRALCPAHDDGEHSLSISAGTKGQRVVWNCFAGCGRGRVRAALIALGIPAGCLPRVAKEKEDLLDLLQRILTADTADHAVVRLRALAAIEGYEGDLPRGGELDRLAMLASMGRATAYRARKAPLPSTHNGSTYPPDGEPVKRRRSEA
jgi:hypothetical protein